MIYSVLEGGFFLFLVLKKREVTKDFLEGFLVVLKMISKVFEKRKDKNKKGRRKVWKIRGGFLRLGV